MTNLLETEQTQSIIVSPTGLILSNELDFNDWSNIGTRFGDALQTATWCIGDWLNYGERKWGAQLIFEGEEFDPKRPNRIPSSAYDIAVKSTGIDRETLSKYAAVCRKIPKEMRSERLSFAHHRILSMLPPDDINGWLGLLDAEPKIPAVKHLSLSVKIHRDTPSLATKDEVLKHSSGKGGHDNYIPHLTRLVTCLRKTCPLMGKDQLDALKADSAPLLAILKAL